MKKLFLMLAIVAIACIKMNATPYACWENSNSYYAYAEVYGTSESINDYWVAPMFCDESNYLYVSLDVYTDGGNSSVYVRASVEGQYCFSEPKTASSSLGWDNSWNDNYPQALGSGFNQVDIKFDIANIHSDHWSWARARITF